MSQPADFGMRDELDFGMISEGIVAIRDAGFTPDEIHASRKAKRDLLADSNFIQASKGKGQINGLVGQVAGMDLKTRPEYGPFRAAVVMDSDKYYYDDATVDLYTL